jgi:hypothetical protein
VGIVSSLFFFLLLSPFLCVCLHSKHERYAHWLAVARSRDHSEMLAQRCLYQSGFDKHGRPVVVFLAKNFPARSVDHEKVWHEIIIEEVNIVPLPGNLVLHKCA